MREFTKTGRRINVVGVDELTAWAAGCRAPNVSATFTLKEYTRLISGYPLRGDPSKFENDYRAFIHRLSEATYGRAYRRYGKMVSNVATLEGDGEAKRFHIHAALHGPKHMDLHEFMMKVEEIWLQSPWAMSDALIEPIRGRWTGYSLKEGSEALLVSAVHL